MQRLSEVVANPSGLDSLANYIGEVPAEEWLVVLTRSRDSDRFTESNWKCAIERLGGEDEEAGVRIDRFGHWACGWWEALSVREGSDKALIGAEIVAALEDCPILDEDDLTERELTEAHEVWKNCYNVEERVAYMRRNRGQFEGSLIELIHNARGEHFSGYASELVSRC